MRAGTFFIVAIVVAAVAGSVGFAISRGSADVPSPICVGKYSLIDPRFNCDEYTDSFAILRTLQSTLESSVSNFQLNGDAKRISVWVRDLSTLQWLGVNEKEVYAPASLFKVPIMIAIFKYAEIQPSVLEQKVVYTAALAGDLTDVLDEQFRLQEGTEYTVEQLVEQMIRYSDNEAFSILTQRLSVPFLTAVYGDLGIHLTQNQTSLDDLVSARSYANIFRILFQSSYLSPEYSQKALTILSNTAYTEGVRAAVPQSVPIAHKFGVRRETDSAGTVVDIKLHDCGIVYAAHTYLYCILTEGSDESRLSGVIKSISGNIYTAFR